MIDLIVVGGGPVGLVSAITAVAAGLDVVVIEPRPGPIDKACGEGLMPAALDQLSALGIEPDGMDIGGIRYVSGSRAAVARFTAGPGRGVRRTVLHEALHRRALDLGVSFRHAKIAGVQQTAHEVSAAGVRAKYLIGADGLHSDVRRSVGLDAPATGTRRYGIRQHFHTRVTSDLVEVYWLPDQEVYVTPVAPDLVGVAVLGRRPLSVPSAIDRLPALAARLVGSKPANAPRGAGPFPQVASGRVEGRVLLVGDAAGYLDALTGEGLRIGFAEAQAAIAAIVDGRPETYEQRWKQITRSYRMLTTTLLRVGGQPALRPTIVPLARTFPRTFTRIVDQIAS